MEQALRMKGIYEKEHFETLFKSTVTWDRQCALCPVEAYP